jgi:hypothetical protein
MKWEDLQKQAAKIVSNKPEGDFADKTFSTRSGHFRVIDGLPVVHRVTSDNYDTVANGSTCATHVTIRCRDTGAKDANDRTIYECEDGTVFVFRHLSGSAECFGSGSLESPLMKTEAGVVMPYREQWAADILGNRSLVECALDVHMTTTGSAERSRDDQNADVKVLADALMKWKQGRPQDERFDNAVRELIGAALAELA